MERCGASGEGAALADRAASIRSGEALVAGMVFQHVSIQSLLRELGRNPDPLGLGRAGGPSPKVVLKEAPRRTGCLALPIFEFTGEA